MVDPMAAKKEDDDLEVAWTRLNHGGDDSIDVSKAQQQLLDKAADDPLYQLGGGCGCWVLFCGGENPEDQALARVWDEDAAPQELMTEDHVSAAGKLNGIGTPRRVDDDPLLIPLDPEGLSPVEWDLGDMGAPARLTGPPQR